MTKRNSTIQSTPKQARKRKTTEAFIQEARDKHGDLYEYSRSKYITAHSKIIITCRKHGDFSQRASSHIEGYGCRMCAHDSLKSNTLAFIKGAIERHGNRYCYSKVSYKSAVKEVVVICSVHGDFKVTPHHHKLGSGCKKCSGVDRSTDDFIRLARDKHGDRYNYTKVDYRKATSEVVVTCKAHGDFLQTPHKHLLGHGCRECGYDAASEKGKSNTKEFIRRAVAVHGSKYRYTNTDYKFSNKKLVIECPEHGFFEQEANSHLQGKGCAQCGLENSGWNRGSFESACEKNKGGEGILYVIRCTNDLEDFLKIGITSLSVKVRFKGRDLPYAYKEIYTIQGDSGYIYDLENRLHSLLTKHSYAPLIPFGGQTECFTTIKPVEKLLKELSNTDQLQLIA